MNNINVMQFFISKKEISGRTVIQAARIEPNTQPGRIWITEAVNVSLRNAAQGQHRLFFSEEIGEVELPKAYGKIRI